MSTHKWITSLFLVTFPLHAIAAPRPKPRVISLLLGKKAPSRMRHKLSPRLKHIVLVRRNKPHRKKSSRYLLHNTTTNLKKALAPISYTLRTTPTSIYRYLSSQYRQQNKTSRRITIGISAFALYYGYTKIKQKRVKAQSNTKKPPLTGWMIIDLFNEMGLIPYNTKRMERVGHKVKEINNTTTVQNLELSEKASQAGQWIVENSQSFYHTLSSYAYIILGISDENDSKDQS